MIKAWVEEGRASPCAANAAITKIEAAGGDKGCCARSSMP
jgi:hypothetical protein